MNKHCRNFVNILNRTDQNSHSLLNGKNILVADDNKLNIKILLFILNKAGATTHIAETGKQALDLIQSTPIDAILMDVHMPEMDGLEATQFIRLQLKSNVPIIGLTATTLESEMGKCIDMGMNRCISKPFDPPKLLEMISELIDGN